MTIISATNTITTAQTPERVKELSKELALTYAYCQVVEAVAEGTPEGRGLTYLASGSFDERWESLNEQEKQACVSAVFTQILEERAVKGEKDKEKATRPDLIYFVLCQMLDSLEGSEKNLILKAGEIEANAKLQQEALLALKDKDMEYHEIPDKADKQTIANIQIYNQQVDQRRSLVQSYIITMRQNGSVGMTEANALVSGLSQKGAMISSWLKALEGITQEINAINRRG